MELSVVNPRKFVAFKNKSAIYDHVINGWDVMYVMGESCKLNMTDSCVFVGSCSI